MIDNPEAIRFVNEQVRPLCEALRALKARIVAAQSTWFATVADNIPNDAQEAIEDGREAEGVSRLDGAQVNSAMSILGAVATATNDEIISIPCVRPLQAE